jgi:gamma-glutamyl phosphate reductase
LILGVSKNNFTNFPKFKNEKLVGGTQTRGILPPKIVKNLAKDTTVDKIEKRKSWQHVYYTSKSDLKVTSQIIPMSQSDHEKTNPAYETIRTDEKFTTLSSQSISTYSYSYRINLRDEMPKEYDIIEGMDFEFPNISITCF